MLHPASTQIPVYTLDVQWAHKIKKIPWRLRYSYCSTTSTTWFFFQCYDLSVWIPQAQSIGAMIHRGLGGETAAPAKMATRSPCPAAAGSRPSASRFGRLRAWWLAGHFARPGGACDTCCTQVLHNNNKFVLVLHSAVLGSAVLQYFFAVLQYWRNPLCVLTGYPVCTLACVLAGYN
jgi:hypothetical protein